MKKEEALKKVKGYLISYLPTEYYEEIEKIIEALEQETKIGHWIVSMDCEGKTRQCTCNLCGYETGKYTWKNPNFCEECGAKMIEPESEE